MSRRSSPAPKRWLKLAKVAELMAIEHPSQHYRVQYVRRLLQRLERRDGTAYLRRFGRHFFVSPTALEQLEPYSPTAVGKLRQDVDDLKDEQGAIRRQLNGHGSRIRRLEEFRKDTVAYLAKWSEQ